MTNRDVNKKNPLVSVLITAYNAERYISSAIESIIYQTYLNIELIIIDDGSTDTTKYIARSYARKHKYISVYSLKKNRGPSHASNFGLKKCNGVYIARMDADDISFPDRIEKQVLFLEKHPEVILVGGQCVLIDKKGKIIGEKSYPTGHTSIYESLFAINPIQHPACMINTKRILKKKLIYHNGSFLAHDLELIFELAQFGKLANLSDSILYYRQHIDSLSLVHPKKTFTATLEVREKAKKLYGYKPTLKGIIIDLVQRILITLLPERYIIPFYIKLRRLGKSNSKELFFWIRPIRFARARLLQL